MRLANSSFKAFVWNLYTEVPRWVPLLEIYNNGALRRCLVNIPELGLTVSHLLFGMPFCLFKCLYGHQLSTTTWQPICSPFFFSSHSGTFPRAPSPSKINLSNRPYREPNPALSSAHNLNLWATEVKFIAI